MALRLVRSASNNFRALSQIRMMSGDELGRGSGKGGGAGGSVREAGGGFGKMEAAREEEYFRRKQAEQLAALKTHIHDEIKFHEKEIKEHEQGLKRHQEKLKTLEEMHKENQ